MYNISIDEKELLQVLKDMISIESVNPSLCPGGAGEAKIAEYIGNYLKSIGLDVKYQEINKGRVNVIGILKGSGGGKSLMLNGHTDTVSIEGMDIEPLNPVYKDGKVYGRGSIDMKGGLASMIGAAKALINGNIKLKGDVYFTFVADEEYESIGTEEIVKEYKADGAVVCEPTDLKVCVAHKGFAWIKIEIFGKAAHGSIPQYGVDAILKAGKILSEIDKLSESLLNSKKHKLLGTPSVHCSIIKGGTELSTYPYYCTIEIERRTIPGESYETVNEEIKNILDKIASGDTDFKCKYEIFFHRPPLEVSLEEPVVKVLMEVAGDIYKKEPGIMGMSGWLDSSILDKASIPAVIFGPSGEGLHAATEYVDFASVVDTSKVLANTIIKFCGSV
ncbi:acetylornithine deacetylase [Oxobacter pfennigii]|uniref:Probable succinyl-diaminopimelate desuccinylase n=1 Tax=Oxobacter pfennigii TaxID=36849 RepID=A0A0P8W577_9CLOT|nr:ArgE/DapE family deacylase [Oxobacter pfennigii]KPU42751.1 acetylornithine deacetylase [Oxobacter pfennigii]